MEEPGKQTTNRDKKIDGANPKGKFLKKTQ